MVNTIYLSSDAFKWKLPHQKINTIITVVTDWCPVLDIFHKLIRVCVWGGGGMLIPCSRAPDVRIPMLVEALL